jgi:hypothetical protein
VLLRDAHDLVYVKHTSNSVLISCRRASGSEPLGWTMMRTLVRVSAPARSVAFPRAYARRHHLGRRGGPDDCVDRLQGRPSRHEVSLLFSVSDEPGARRTRTGQRAVPKPHS